MIPVVHLLTNSAGGFTSPALPRVSRFTPSPMPSHVQRVRTLLGLTPASDYLTNAYLRQMQMQPDLWTPLSEGRPDPTVLSAHRPDVPYVSQGRLVHDGMTPAAVVRKAAEWPVQREIKVQLNGGGVARIHLGELEWQNVRVRASGSDDLCIDWPAELGVAGRMRRDGGWDAVEEFTIWHEPVGFPYRALFDVLQHDEDVHVVLAAAESLDAFLNTVDPARGTALVLAALVKTHPQFKDA